ncbi:MAG: type IV toxin-antitoxin system AbiEi family antitoxin domain-containing protein [Simkaniaceae bacterium]|nr:type IV toxin-antitoxin system AbiEi family antitoxin domain-containing protein [Simkaniaceae bacterium]
MKKSKALKAVYQLLAQPSFTAAEAKELGVSTALLGYYVKTGQIRRLGRGIYQGIDYQSSPKNFRWKDLIDAVNSVPGGVVCLISALAIYEIIDEIPRQHWIAVSHSTSIDRGTKVKIVRLRNMDLGKTTVDLGGVQAPIFDRERTIIDAFRLLSQETAIKALKIALSSKSSKRLDLRKLQAYAKKLRFNISPYLISATT